MPDPELERDLEAPEADVAEQSAQAGPEPAYAPPDEISLDADGADVAEQSVEVGAEDEDYR